MTTTKERPIRFRSEDVRAILNGSKRQTRQIVKDQGDMEFDANDPTYGPYWLPYATEADGEGAKVRCPFGKPGACRDIAKTSHSPKWFPELVQVGSRGICHVWAESVEEFIAQCTRCNLEWLIPASPVLSHKP